MPRRYSKIGWQNRRMRDVARGHGHFLKGRLPGWPASPLPMPTARGLPLQRLDVLDEVGSVDSGSTELSFGYHGQLNRDAGIFEPGVQAHLRTAVQPFLPLSSTSFPAAREDAGWGTLSGDEAYDEFTMDMDNPDLWTRVDHVELRLQHLRDRVDARIAGVVRVQNEGREQLREVVDEAVSLAHSELDHHVTAYARQCVKDEVERLQKEAALAVESQQKSFQSVIDAMGSTVDSRLASITSSLEASQETHIAEIEKAFRWRDDVQREASLQVMGLDARLSDVENRCSAFQVRDFQPLVDVLAALNARPVPPSRGLLGELDRVQSLATEVGSCCDSLSALSARLDGLEHGFTEVSAILDQKFAILRKDLDESLAALSQQFCVVQQASKMLKGEVNKADTAIASHNQALDRLTQQVQSAGTSIANKLDGKQVQDLLLSLFPKLVPTLTQPILGEVAPLLRGLEQRVALLELQTDDAGAGASDTEWVEG